MKKIEQPLKMNNMQEIRDLNKTLNRDFVGEILKQTEIVYEELRKYNELVEIFNKLKEK